VSDLFSAAATERLAAHAPLADRLRPVRLDDVVGQRHLLGEGAPLRSLIEADRLSSVILWGPPGTGKTTLARVIARTTSKAFEALSAVSAGVKDVRDVTERAQRRLGEHEQGTILFLDEVHRFNKAQQDALLPAVESGLVVLIGATTENPYFEVNAPLLSRSTLFRLEPLSPEDLELLLRRAIDFERHEVSVSGKLASLTPKEFDLLKLLVESDGKVLSRDQLLEKVWGHEKGLEISTRTVDQHIARLRRKLATDGKRIVTVTNSGYRLRG
jgi:replication-associated recombination protein RarA